MTKYGNGKLVKEPVTKNIIINVYAKDGLHSVTTGGFLGTIDMHPVGSSPDFAGTGSFRGKTYPVEVYVNGLGNVPPQKTYIGNAFVEDNVIMDVTPYISDYRLEALNDVQRADLQHISTKALHAELIGYLQADLKGVGWTNWLSAIQEADQSLGLPKSTWTPQYQEIEGRKAIGCDIVVDVNGARFLFGEGGFVRCSDGRDLYQFWTAAAVGIFPDGDVYYPND